MAGDTYRTRKVNIGGSAVGGGERIKIQSMCTPKTSHTDDVLGQISALADAGCDIVRVSVTDRDDAAAIRKIKDGSPLPVVADIHFSAELGVAAIENGCDKIRINPGNIGDAKAVDRVADAVKAHGIPVRVGVNTGSIKKEYERELGRTPEALVRSALDEVRELEKRGVDDIVISVKGTSVPFTVRSYELLAGMTDRPLHIGVTEAGVERQALLKSAAAFSPLLLKGIGDTVRVSVSGDPVKEVYAARDILRVLEMDRDYAEVIACPTCGRCRWDCAALAERVSERCRGIRKRMSVAVMGCEVNGPGEARECDIGIAGGDGYCMIFKEGVPYRKVSADRAEEEFMKEIEALADGHDIH